MAEAQESLSLAVVKRIDAACDRFEAEWKAGKKPTIENHLGSTAGAERAELLRLLLKLELELQGAGNKSNQAAYEARFPGDAAIVQSVFRDPSERTTSQRAVASADTSVSKDSVPSKETRAYAPEETPKKVGRFEIIEVLGQGAFGRVYKARDPQLDRFVAIKVPLRGALDSQDEIDRFLREAKAAATLHHPNLCPVHEVGQDGGTYFIVMAFVEGKTLSALLKERKEPVAAKQAAIVVRKLALALGAAHAKGIVHRDLKPSNVMIERERKDVIVMDFGMARRRKNGDAKETREGVVMGTPAYMSPEQARGDVKAIGPASDFYSVGVILYEMLAGKVPFSGSVTEVLGKVLHVEPEPPSTHRSGVDPQLEAICLKALAKEPGQRFGSMKALVDALEAYLKGMPGESVTAPPRVKDKASARATGLTQVVEALAAERKRDRQALEKTVRQHSRKLFYAVMAAAGLLGLLIAASGIIMFYFRTPNTLVQVTLITKIDQRLLDDRTIVYFFDDNRMSKEDLERPIKLTPGRHVLQARRGDVVVQEVTLIAGGEGNNAKIDVTTTVEYDPTPTKIDTPKKTVDLPTPVAHWTFDGPPESLAVDKIGKIKQGKIVGDVKQVEGKFGKAASFPGSVKAFIEIPNQPLLNFKKQATLACWVKVAPDAPNGLVIYKWYALDSYSVGVTDSGVSMAVALPTGDAWGTPAGVESPIKRNVWTHVAGVFDGVEIRFFIDGRLVKRQVLSQHPAMRATTMFKETGKLPMELQQSANPVHLGLFKGLLDEVKLFDVALTPEQVAKLAGAKLAPAIVWKALLRSADELVEGEATSKARPGRTVRFKDGTLELQGPMAGYYPRFSGKDYVIRAKVLQHPGDRFQFRIRQQPGKPGYGAFFEVFESGGSPTYYHVGIGRDHQGKWANLTVSDTHLTDTFPVEVAMCAYKNQLSIYVDGKRVLNCTDDKYAEGTCGFLTIRDDHAFLRDLEVCVLDGTDLTPEDVIPQLTRADYGFVRLFRPNDLAGWEGLPGAWWVDQGAIHGKLPAGRDKHTFLYNSKKYRDFELTFRVKLKDGKGNSGVQIRSTVIDPKEYILAGPQVEIDAKMGGLYGERTSGGWMQQVPASAWERVFKPNEFNAFRVRAVGKHVTVTVNGEKLVDGDFPTMADEGIIALQLHGGGPKGNMKSDDLIFKDMAIKELPSRLSEAPADPNRAAAEWVLSVGGLVCVASADRIPATFSEYNALPHLEKRDQLPQTPFRLVGIGRLGKHGTDAAMARFAQLPSFRGVNLEGSPLTDKGLATLARCDGLICLDVNRTQVTNAGLASIETMSNLHFLRLDQLPITDRGVAHLRMLKKLESLHLWNTKLTRVGLRDVATLTSLTSLQVSCVSLDDDALAELKPLTRLVFLNLSGSKVTGSGLAHLKDLPELRVLHLGEGNSLTDDGLQALGELKQLAGLALFDIDSRRLSNAALRPIRTLLNLEELDLALPKLTDGGLDALTPLKKLRRLSISNNPGVTDTGLDRLRKALPGCRIFPERKAMS